MYEYLFVYLSFKEENVALLTEVFLSDDAFVSSEFCLNN